MRIVSIFGVRLSAFHYDDEAFDEVRRLFKQWYDPEFLEDFFTKNLQDVQSGFFGPISIERAITATRAEAVRLERELERLSKNEQESLDKIFQPLDIYRDDEFHRSKAKGDRHKSWLRIYALKIDSNVYVVTGGAIKLTRLMQERAHTNRELQKFERCRDYLHEQGITDIDGFMELDL
jgi:hypothetical protein